MRRTGYVGTLLILILLLASAVPAFSQAAKAKQLRTQPEYNSYMACYNEKDSAKKGDLCDKFTNDFKDSDYLAEGYRMAVGSYSQVKNWQKVYDIADRYGALPAADKDTKLLVYLNAMNAAQSANDTNKLVSYGDKALSVDPNNLNALLILSGVIAQQNPTNKAQLDKAAEMANKALAGVQDLMAKAPADQKAQFVQIDGNLHSTLGFVAYNEKDYKKSIAEYQTAIKDNMKDDVSHFYLAYDYIALMGQASKAYLAAIDDEKAAIAAKADQPTMDDLKAKTAGHADDVTKNRDMVIDELALAVAINGPVAAQGQAKTELTKQWNAKNNSDAGLDAFIDQKKSQLK